MKISQLSKDDLFKITEFQKCKNDIIYWCENYAKIPSPGGSTTIKLYEPQKGVLDSFVNDHHCVVLKSRQVGCSTLSQLYIAHCCTFYENVVIGVLSRSGDEASDFNRKTANLLEELPDWMRPKFEKRTEQTFILENGCQSFSSGVNPANPSSVFRGKSLSILICDESAFVNCIDQAYASCAPSLVKAQQTARLTGNPYATLIISTPNSTVGTGKFYFDMWTKANSGQSIYKPIYLHWKQIKEFADDPLWYKTQCELLGNVEWKIAQELNCEFIQGGNAFFPAKTLRYLQSEEHKDKCHAIRDVNLDGAILTQWKEIDPDRMYLIGIDTASAFGSDSSTIQVVDYIDCEQVAELHIKCRVDEFCPIIKKVATMYPNNLIIFEANSFGNQVGEYLTKNNQSFNIYQSKQRSPILNSKLRNKIKYRYGIYTNPQNRPLIIDSLYTCVTENPDCVKSNNTVLELLSLIHDKNGKVQADEGCHDDLSMALAFCFYVREYDPPVGLKAIMGSKEAIQDSMEIINWNNNSKFDTTSLIKNPYGSTAELEKHDMQEVLNKQIQDFVSNNFNSLITNYYNQVKGNSTINILDILGRK